MGKLVIYSISFIGLGLSSASLGPTLPALAAQTQVEMKQISRLFIARALGTLIGSLLIGRLYDRIAGHPLLALSIVSSAAGLALVPSMNLLWGMSGLFLFLGINAGSINVGGNTLIAMAHGERLRPFISTLHFAFGLGGLLAPMLVAHFEHHPDGMRLTYWILAIIGLPAAVFALLSPSPVLKLHKEGESKSRIHITTLVFFILFFFLQIGAETSLMGWIFSYSLERGVRNNTAAYMNSAFWGAFCVGRLATIGMANRFNPLSIMFLHLSLCATIAIALLLLPASPLVLWMGSIAMGLMIAPIFPNTFGFAQRTLGLTGKVTGWFLVGSAAGGMFWPWLIGQFFKSRGPQVMVWAVLIALIGALAILIPLGAHPTPARGFEKDAGC